MHKKLLPFIIFFLFSADIFAATYYIATDGSDNNDGSSSSPFATIQKGIDVANNSDIVLVAAGTYTENINYNGKNIVVGSLYLTTQDTSYISSTVIDGDQNGSVVTIQNNSGISSLIGLKIYNGSGNNGSGGGIHISSADPLLTLPLYIFNPIRLDMPELFCIVTTLPFWSPSMTVDEI
jgi:hypothetical protein